MTTAWTFEPSARPGRPAQRRRLEERIAVLERTPLFANLGKKHARTLAKSSADEHVPADRELVVEGRPGSVFYAIVSGTAKVVRGGRTVKRLGPGDFFGEMSILTRSPRSASVITETALDCVTLSASALRSVLLAEPTIALRMLTVMAERLEDADRRITL